MSKAAELAALIGSQSALSNRNLIINGAMQAWQRGTSQSSNNYSSVDRWTFYAGSGMSVSQSTDVPSEFKYSCSFGGTGNSSGLTTRLEGQDCARLVGKDITVSFYLKQTTGAGSGAIVVALLYADTLDNFGGTTYIGQPTVDTTSDWVRYEVTFTNLPAQAANGLALNFKTPSSSAVVFLITGVQLEVGEQATPFEHRSFGDELQRCMRYYEKSYPYSVAPSTASAYPGNIGITVRGMDEETSGQRYITNTMRVEKRTNPTNTFYDDAGNAGKVTTFNNAGTATNNVSVGLVVTQPSMIGCGPGNSAIWGFGFYYESDAEL